jgi:HPt (histidine-containing phosphotransfer) domain-containing protein
MTWTKPCESAVSFLILFVLPCWPSKIKDLATLSSLGHFLKGSSAALGVFKVQASCEKIQHYGQLRDEEESKDLTSEAALGKIEPLLGTVKEEYAAAEKWMKEWYLQNDPDGEKRE